MWRGTKWTFHNLVAGSYTFGTAPLTGMPSKFASPPAIMDCKENDSDYYITDPTTTGFTIVDRKEGEEPLVTVLIIQN